MDKYRSDGAVRYNCTLRVQLCSRPYTKMGVRRITIADNQAIVDR